jgi:hypothetical protein
MGVGFARGEQIESSLAFGVAREALGEVAQLDREPVADSSAPYYRVLQGLQERGNGPLLVAVDDLHWADPDSLRLIAFLVRRLEGMPVALIGTLRPWPPEAVGVCEELAAGGHCVVERLVALSRPAAAALLVECADGGGVGGGGAWRVEAVCGESLAGGGAGAGGVARGAGAGVRWGAGYGCGVWEFVVVVALCGVGSGGVGVCAGGERAGDGVSS